MEQFFYRTENRTSDPGGRGSLIIEGDEHFHLSRVLRLKSGERILATDGNGTTCLCVVTKIGKDQTSCDIEEVFSDLNSTVREFWIAIAILKPISKLELSVEKCTEIGAAGFFFFPAQRSEKISLKLDRMEAIVRSAVKQSLRSRVPQIHLLESLEKLVRNSEHFAARFALHEKSLRPIEDLLGRLGRSENAIAVVGPEGGFTDDELSSMKAGGFTELSLGKTRLRSETAAIKIASLLSNF